MADGEASAVILPFVVADPVAISVAPSYSGESVMVFDGLAVPAYVGPASGSNVKVLLPDPSIVTPLPLTVRPVVPFGAMVTKPVVEEPIVSGAIACVSMVAVLPRIVRRPETLALPVTPLRRISALEVAVVDWPPPTVLPNAKLRSTTG